MNKNKVEELIFHYTLCLITAFILCVILYAMFLMAKDNVENEDVCEVTITVEEIVEECVICEVQPTFKVKNLDLEKVKEGTADDIEPVKTIYDVYSEYEIYLIQRAVETEVYQCDFEEKCNVASVIFNRINDGRFGSSVKEVITKPRQFAYHRTKISESTIEAVEYVFLNGDTTDGCIAFRSDKKPDKWGKWIYSFSDNAVHHFYKEYKEEEENGN